MDYEPSTYNTDTSVDSDELEKDINYDELDDFLEDEDYSFQNERLEYKNPTIIEIDIPSEILKKYDFIDQMPPCVAVMGGVSRSIARQILTGDIEPIRDIDLISISDYGGQELDDQTRHELSLKYMPDDYSFGHGMDNTSKDEYFTTRDFTINESLIINGKLLISQQAVNDLLENIIRPTYYEMPCENYWLDGKLVIKALLMQTMLYDVTGSVPCIEDMVINDQGIPPFYIALGLNKALERGAEIARGLVAKLIEWGMLPQELSDRPKAAARFLAWQTGDFKFRTSKQAKDFESLTADLDGYYKASPIAMRKYYSSNREIREAIDEYQSSRDGSEEVVSGQYDEVDYKWINS